MLICERLAFDRKNPYSIPITITLHRDYISNRVYHRTMCKSSAYKKKLEYLKLFEMSFMKYGWNELIENVSTGRNFSSKSFKSTGSFWSQSYFPYSFHNNYTKTCFRCGKIFEFFHKLRSGWVYRSISIQGNTIRKCKTGPF